MSDLTLEQLKRVAEYVGHETIHIQKGIVEIYDGDFEEWVRYTGTTPEQSMELLKMLLDKGVAITKDSKRMRGMYWVWDTHAVEDGGCCDESLEQAILLAAWEVVSHE